MASSRQTIEQRDAAKAELQSIHARHPGDLPEDAQQRWDELTAEIGTLEKRLARQATLDDLDRAAVGRPLGGGAPGRPEVRVWAGSPTTTPEAFDGAILRG